MRAPRWRTVLTAASCLVIATLVMLCFSVSRVRSLPCKAGSVSGGGAQLAKIVCFITASSEHYDYESLRTGMCSHVVLIDLMGVGKDGSLELLQASSRSLNRFTRMKQRFRDVGDEAKFMVSIGGVAQKSSQFSKALKTTESRQALTDELVSFNIKHGLDGIDIAWFYPAQFGGVESDRTNLVVFLRDLSLRTKACDIALSLTVGVDPKDIELSYDVQRINEVVDFVNLLTGDYHNPTVPTHISPLYGQGPRDRLNINYSVMSYIEAGLNPRKIVILNSCYAYLYVSKINKNDTICPVKLRTVMRLSFLSAREIIIRESFQTSWDDMRHVPYGTVTNGVTKKWITYSDVESIRRKADYVLHYQLGGMGLFSVDEDDYGGRAGCGRYPMLRTIVSVLYPDLACDELDEEEGHEIETIVCPYNGYLADPVLPEYYYDCEQGVDLQACPKQRCPQGEIFDEGQNSCCQQTYPVQTSPMVPTMYNYDPASLLPSTIGPSPYVAPVAYAQPRAIVTPMVAPIATTYKPLPPQYPNLLSVQAQSSLLGNGPVLDVSLTNLFPSASTMAPQIYEPMQQPSNMISQVVISPNSMHNSGDHVGSSSTMAPIVVEPMEQHSNVVPIVAVNPNSPLDLTNATEVPSSMASTSITFSEPLQESSTNMVSQVVITPNSHESLKEVIVSSTILTPQASDLVQEASNIVPKVLITANSMLGAVNETELQDEIQLLVTSKPRIPEQNAITDPTVLITPKVRYNLPSRKSSSGRRKSRSRSHRARTTTEASTTVAQDESLESTTEVALSVSSTSTTCASSTARSRLRARKTTTTMLTSIPTTTTTSTETTTTPTTTTVTTTTPTTSTTTTATEPPTTTKTSTVVSTTTTTLAATETSTPTATSSAVMSGTSSDSTTLSPNVTLTDKTTASASAAATTTTSAPMTVSSTWVITTTATTTVNATQQNDAASHLVTTVT